MPRGPLGCVGFWVLLLLGGAHGGMPSATEPAAGTRTVVAGRPILEAPARQDQLRRDHRSHPRAAASAQRYGVDPAPGQLARGDERLQGHLLSVAALTVLFLAIAAFWRRGWGSRLLAVESYPMAMAAATGANSRFPVDYGDILRFASRATAQMVKAQQRLIEIDFPVAGLAAVFGDEEGGVEMTRSAQFVAEFTRCLPPDYKAVRVYFPDQAEAERQRELFVNQSRVRVDHLTQPTGLSELGWDIFKRNARRMFRDDDDLFVVAYPSFNPNEMIQVKEIYEADDRQRPIVIINGELDRIRTGYYPAFFYPRLQSAMKDFLPKVDQGLYLHNYKGAAGGALYRVYPEPWQVFRRDNNGLRVVCERPTMPSSREVALDILPKYP